MNASVGGGIERGLEHVLFGRMEAFTRASSVFLNATNLIDL